MVRIEVTREAPDRLSDQVWQFSVSSDWSSDEVRLLLGYYARRQRATTRHKMKLEAGRPSQWDRTEQRSYHSGIEANDVPLPDDVKAEAIAALKIVVIGASR
jgi:hypothetical protein